MTYKVPTGRQQYSTYASQSHRAVLPSQVTIGLTTVTKVQNALVAFKPGTKPVR